MGVTPDFALLADTVSTVESFVDVFIGVYILLILAYIILSWIRLPYSLWLSRIQRFLYDVCDPYLRMFRRILPPFGPLDLSPMVGVIVLIVLQQVLHAILDRLPEKGRFHVALTPVEIRHINPQSLVASATTAHVVDKLLEDIVESFEQVWRERADLADKIERVEEDLVRHRELETLLRTTLVSAERASQELKEQARREATIIVEEAHAEARKGQA